MTTQTQTNRDSFGNAQGSKKASVNAALSHKPKTMKQIMEDAKVDQTFYNHLNRLVREGKVIRDEDGKYSLPAQASAKKAATKRRGRHKCTVCGKKRTLNASRVCTECSKAPAAQAS